MSNKKFTRARLPVPKKAGRVILSEKQKKLNHIDDEETLEAIDKYMRGNSEQAD